VLLYGRKESAAFAELEKSRQNEYLELEDNMELTRDTGRALENETIIISVGVQDLRALCRELAAHDTAGKTFLLAMKGLEVASAKTPSQVFRDELGGVAELAILAGPGHVQDYVRGVPSCAVVDSENPDVKARLAAELSSPLIRFYYGDDFIGNQVGAALKNVIGIAAGVLDGLGWQGLKGGLMVRAPREVGRLIKHYGGNERSAYGLAHLGDYEATLFSAHSHNRMYGEAFVRHEKFGKLAEGHYTLAAVKKISDAEGIDMPIAQAL
jgi:glycerol-3-phosphate dehydrogenase (NAD(P)+)